MRTNTVDFPRRCELLGVDCSMILRTGGQKFPLAAKSMILTMSIGNKRKIDPK